MACRDTLFHEPVCPLPALFTNRRECPLNTNAPLTDCATTSK